MSDFIPVQHESALAVLRDRERDLGAEIQTDSRALELKTARHDELLDLIAALSRKPRVRAPRAITRPAAAANDQPEACAADAGDASPRPTVFATPSLEVADAA
jgi:hypothetical protein